MCSADGFLHELLVSAAEVVGVCSQVLAELPVIDISISDPPIEEDLLKLFMNSQTPGKRSRVRPGSISREPSCH